MTNMAAMPIYGKNLKKSSSPEPIDRWPWNLVCSIVYESSTKPGPDPEHSNAGGHQGWIQNNRIRGYDVSGVSRNGGEYERGYPPLI